MANVSLRYLSKLPLFLPGAIAFLALASPNCKDASGSGGNSTSTSSSATSGATTSATGSNTATATTTTSTGVTSSATTGSTSSTVSSSASGMIPCGGGDGGPAFCNPNQCCVNGHCFNSSEQPSNSQCGADEQCASCKCGIISDAGFFDGGPGTCQ